MRNFIPVHVHQNSSRPDLFRVDVAEASPPGYKRVQTMHGLSPFLFPPAIMGATLFRFTSLSSPPYHTLNIQSAFYELSDFLSFSRSTNQVVRQSDGKIFLYVFFYVRAFEFCKPFRYINQIDRGNMPFAEIDLTVGNMPYVQGTQYFFYLERPELYWSCSLEGCCVPSRDPGQYQTLQACQIHCYNDRLQRTVLTTDSQRFLHSLLAAEDRSGSAYTSRSGSEGCRTGSPGSGSSGPRPAGRPPAGSLPPACPARDRGRPGR